MADKAIALRNAMAKEKPLAVVLTETHQTASEQNLPSFPGYTTTAHPGLSQHSGGIAIVVRNDIIGTGQIPSFPGINTTNGVTVKRIPREQEPEALLLDAQDPDSTAALRTRVSSRTLVPGDKPCPAVSSRTRVLVDKPCPAAQENDDGKPSSSQLAGLSLHLHGDSVRPIWLLAAYIQPHSHESMLPEFKRQLESLCQSADDAAIDSQPFIVLAGDFNLGVRDLQPQRAEENKHERAFYDALETLGFQCANAQPDQNFPTHRNEAGVLDLLWERPPLGGRPLCSNLSRRGDLRAPENGFPLISDHFLITAKFHPDAARNILPLPDNPPRYRWRTDNAGKEQHARCTAEIERICNEQKDILSGSELGDVVTYKPTTAAEKENLCLRPAQSVAQECADALWHALVTAAHTGARAAYEKVRVDNRPAVQSAYQNNHTHKLARLARIAAREALRDPENAQKQKRQTDAQHKLRAALNDYFVNYWQKAKEETQAATEDDRPTVAWEKVRRFLRPKTDNVSPGIKIAGSVTTTVEESATALSSHFESVFKPHPEEDDQRESVCAGRNQRNDDLGKLRTELRSCDTLFSKLAADGRWTQHPDLFLLPAGEAGHNDLRELLLTASKHTAAGPDDLTGDIIRQAALSKTWLLCMHHLVNFCWVFGVLPLDWRSGNMVCLLKRGKSPDDCASYRPITVTSIVIRLVERLVKKKLEARLEPLLSKWQHGFRSGRHAMQTMFRLHQAITDGTRRWATSPLTAAPQKKKAAADGTHSRAKKKTANTATSQHKNLVQPYPAVFLDIQRAFDSAPQDYVLLKLWRKGVAGAELRWIGAFLANRRFRICTDTVVGEWKKIEAGVPQGAVLSPLLYAVFIDDALPNVAAEIAFREEPGHLLYADDIVVAAVTGHAGDRRNQIQSRLNDIDAWASVWKVRFSISKSGCVWFHQSTRQNRDSESMARKQTPFTLLHSAGSPNATIPNVQQYLYLGVWFHEKLRSDPHFAHVYAKCQRRSAALSSLVSQHGPPGFVVTRMLVQATLLPIMRYGAQFVAYTVKQLAKLDALLYAPLQRCLGVPRTTHRASLAAVVGIPQMHWQKSYAQLQYICSELGAVASLKPAERERLPSALLLSRKITQQAAIDTEPIRVEKNDARRRARNLRIDERSFTRNALLDFKLWSAIHLLPTAATLDKWKPQPLRKYLRRSLHAMQLFQLHLETQGKRLITAGRNAHARVLFDYDAAGIHTATQLGAFLAAPADTVMQVRDAAALADKLYFRRGILDALSYARDSAPPSRQAERLRAQLLLDRTDLGTSRYAHAKPKTDVELQCRHCREDAIAARRIAHYYNEREHNSELLARIQSQALTAAQDYKNETLSKAVHHPGPASSPIPDELVVLTSTIPSANGGLYTLSDLPGSFDVGDYTGEVLTKAELARRYPSKPRHLAVKPTYVLELRKNGGTCIDARDARLSGLARYINHAPRARRTDAAHANCELTADGKLRTLFPIPAGSELLVSYGSGYVTSHRLPAATRLEPSPLRLAFALEAIATAKSPEALPAFTLTELQRIIANASRLPQTPLCCEFITAAQCMLNVLRPILTPPADQADPPGLSDNIAVPLETVPHALLDCPHSQADLRALKRDNRFLRAREYTRSAVRRHPELKSLAPTESDLLLCVITATPALFATLPFKHRRWMRKSCDRFLRKRLGRDINLANTLNHLHLPQHLQRKIHERSSLQSVIHRDTGPQSKSAA